MFLSQIDIEKNNGFLTLGQFFIANDENVCFLGVSLNWFILPRLPISSPKLQFTIAMETTKVISHSNNWYATYKRQATKTCDISLWKYFSVVFFCRIDFIKSEIEVLTL